MLKIMITCRTALCRLGLDVGGVGLLLLLGLKSTEQLTFTDTFTLPDTVCFLLSTVGTFSQLALMRR